MAGGQVMTFITYHDATVEGHFRVLKVTWASEDEAKLCGYGEAFDMYGDRLEPPKGLESWLEYDAWHDDRECVVLSKDGD
jgi:hypothetical protein